MRTSAPNCTVQLKLCPPPVRYRIRPFNKWYPSQNGIWLCSWTLHVQGRNASHIQHKTRVNQASLTLCTSCATSLLKAADVAASRTM